MTLFQSQTRRLLPRNEEEVTHLTTCNCKFQSQTRRLLPRNKVREWVLRNRQKMFQSQTRRLLPRNLYGARLTSALVTRFNRRRDACFPATRIQRRAIASTNMVSIADATLASPQRP